MDGEIIAAVAPRPGIKSLGGFRREDVRQHFVLQPGADLFLRDIVERRVHSEHLAAHSHEAAGPVGELTIRILGDAPLLHRLLVEFQHHFLELIDLALRFAHERVEDDIHRECMFGGVELQHRVGQDTRGMRQEDSGEIGGELVIVVQFLFEDVL